MEDILKLLEIDNYHYFRELQNSYVCNLDEDKILIIKHIEQLDEIDELVSYIPSVRNKIISEINNEKNLEFVNETKMPMAKFLWDLYIVALHKVTNSGDKFLPELLARYERDRFIARKIIIQYGHEKELVDEFRRVVFPHKDLDRISLLDTYDSESKINYEQLDEFLRKLNDFLD